MQRKSGKSRISILRKASNKAQSFDKRLNMIFGQEGAEDLTPEIIEQLLAEGWERETLKRGAQEGARYSPSRGAACCTPQYRILTPMMVTAKAPRSRQPSIRRALVRLRPTLDPKHTGHVNAGAKQR